MSPRNKFERIGLILLIVCFVFLIFYLSRISYSCEFDSIFDRLFERNEYCLYDPYIFFLTIFSLIILSLFSLFSTFTFDPLIEWINTGKMDNFKRNMYLMKIESNKKNKFVTAKNYFAEINNPHILDSQKVFYREQSIKLMSEAANLNYMEAQFNLGMIYWAGLLVPKDTIEAFKWANIAASQGYPEAIKLRDQLLKDMTPSQIEEGQHKAKDWMDKALKEKIE